MKTQLLLTTLVCIASLQATVLPSGSELELRLLNRMGSRISRVGDPVRAAIITPVIHNDGVLIPAGAIVSGVVDQVESLGLGLRHTAARLRLQFTTLHLPDGTTVAIHGQLVSVEEARESVNEDGVVIGIHPSASFSTGVSSVCALFFLGEPEFRLPVIGFKLLAAHSPDAEINFPAGTEMLLRLTQDVPLHANSSNAAAVGLPPISASEATHFQELLASLPEQQTERDGRYASDPINFVLVGSRESIERTFSAAGWHGGERHDVMALYHMYHCVVERVGYSSAAMTNLTFNGKPPNITFQKSLNTLAKRHHIRLWRSVEPDVWLGAATEDVRYRVRRLRITHDIDRDIDNERAKVVNDLAYSGCVSRGGLIPRASLGLLEEDAQPIFTDGKVAVVQLNGCDNPHVTPRDPKSPPGVRSVVIARSVVEDIGRSNPVSVGYAMAAWMFARSTTRASTRVQGAVHYTRPIAIANPREPQTPESRPVVSATRVGSE